MATSCEQDDVFRAFTACPNDIKTLILDLRHQKLFKREHINQSYCIRVSSDGRALVDHSQSRYEVLWSQGAWWGKHVLAYGEPGLKKDHPVIDFLIKEKQCKSLMYYKEGFDTLKSNMPYLCTTSTKASSIKRYPSQIIPKVLYLGDWSHAEAAEDLDDINIKRVVTIHNHPENLRLPSRFNHLRLEMPDVESADISRFFNQVYDYIEEGRVKEQAVLVHCGAGVSRSATLCIMYLMRSNMWPASKARDHVVLRRSLVCVNDGFWRSLCALEGPLGVSLRSDPNDTSGYQEEDAPPVQLSKDAAGEKVKVNMVNNADLKRKGEPSDRGGLEDGGAKRLKGTEDQKTPAGTLSGVYTITLAVSKPEGSVGDLILGPMRPTQRVIIGRVPSCDVVLEHLSISRQHAMVSVDAVGCAFITDLQSGHGTKLDDVWIKAQVARQIKIGSVIQFGASTRKYKVLSIAKG